LEIISFNAIVKEAESRRHGICSDCMTDKDSKINAINSTSVQSVCATAALTDSSSNKKHSKEKS